MYNIRRFEQIEDILKSDGFKIQENNIAILGAVEILIEKNKTAGTWELVTFDRTSFQYCDKYRDLVYVWDWT